MAVTYGFYDSVSSDRVYNAQQMGAIFDGIILDGVFSNVENGLAVVENTGMNVNVSTGRAWFDSTWTYCDAPFGITVPTADALLPRIDVIYLEVNKEAGTRANSFNIQTGTPASSPTPPALGQTSTVTKYALAEIYVGAGVTSITQSNITSKIGSSGTPYVKGPLINIVTDDTTLQLVGGVLKVKNEGIGVAQIANKTRSIWITPGEFAASWGYQSAGYAWMDVSANYGAHIGLTDDQWNRAYFTIGIPKDFVSGTAISFKGFFYSSLGTGGIRVGVGASKVQAGGSPLGSDVSPSNVTATIGTTLQVVQVNMGSTPNLTVTYPQYLYCQLNRDPNHAGDTINQIIYCVGILAEYTADS
jgi:hypothetical protein